MLDNIANVFAHAGALLLTVFLSFILFSFTPTILFFCGCYTIFSAIVLYQNNKAPPVMSVHPHDESVPCAFLGKLCVCRPLESMCLIQKKGVHLQTVTKLSDQVSYTGSLGMDSIWTRCSKVLVHLVQSRELWDHPHKSQEIVSCVLPSI